MRRAGGLPMAFTPTDVDFSPFHPRRLVVLVSRAPSLGLACMLGGAGRSRGGSHLAASQPPNCQLGSPRHPRTPTPITIQGPAHGFPGMDMHSVFRVRPSHPQTIQEAGDRRCSMAGRAVGHGRLVRAVGMAGLWLATMLHLAGGEPGRQGGWLNRTVRSSRLNINTPN